MQIIENILSRHEEINTGITLAPEEKEALRNLWAILDSPVSRILAEYPTHEGDYEQRDSGVECRFVAEHQIWLCCDEEDGFYLASDDEAQSWTLDEKDAQSPIC